MVTLPNYSPFSQILFPVPLQGLFSWDDSLPGGRFFSPGKGNRTSTTSVSREERILVSVLLSPQEIRGVETLSRPLTTERFYSKVKMQDGYPNINNPLPTGGSVACGSRLSVPQKVPLFLIGQEHYQYRVLPFQISAHGIHKGLLYGDSPHEVSLIQFSQTWIIGSWWVTLILRSGWWLCPCSIFWQCWASVWTKKNLFWPPTEDELYWHNTRLNFSKSFPPHRKISVNEQDNTGYSQTKDYSQSISFSTKPHGLVYICDTIR